MRPLRFGHKRKLKVTARAPDALQAPDFVWCSESEATYSWMNKELVEFVVQGVL